ncbi:MAG: hypothetical protein RL572_193 [Pseudomonadota bacterium]|jgi:hypothetical protein
MKCPVCGTAELIHDTRNLPYTDSGDCCSSFHRNRHWP